MRSTAYRSNGPPSSTTDPNSCDDDDHRSGGTRYGCCPRQRPKKTLTSGHRVEITMPHEPMRQDTDRFWNFDDVVDDEAAHAAATAVDDNVGAAAVDVEAPLPLQPPQQQGSSSINAGPKKSIGCWNGFVQEISPLYVLFWCIVCGLVVVAVVGVLVVGVDDDSDYYNWGDDYSYCEYIFFECRSWPWKVGMFGAVPAFILWLLKCACSYCGCCWGCDSTVQYLGHRKKAFQVEKQLRQCLVERPLVYFRVVCSHEETEYYTDSDGNRKSRTRTVVTYDAREPVLVTSCRDVTVGKHRILGDNGEASSALRDHRLTKVKLTQTLVPGPGLLAERQRCHDRNKHRDVHCNVTEQMTIRAFQPYILSYVSSPRFDASWTQTVLLTPACYLLAHALLFPALPYRLWMCSITGKIKLNIRKEIDC